MDQALRDEARALIAMAREHLRMEEASHGLFVPPVTLAARVERAAPPREVERVEAPTPPATTRVPEARPVAAVTPQAARPATVELRAGRLQVLAQEAAACTACRLHSGRSKSVFARGNPESPVVFVGEGPGQNEDLQGEPFVGAAGQLLDKMIVAMGFARDDVYICNVVKCRPPENRTPQADEAKACSRFLDEQLGIVAPKVIVALGRCAAESLGVAEPDERGWRGAWKSWRGIPVMSTYHPAYLLRSPEAKRPVWNDLQEVMARLR